VVSNVTGRVLSGVQSGSFTVWTLEASFDLQNDSNTTCRIWPGLHVLEPDRMLADSGDKREGYYVNYASVSGDTAVSTGTGYHVQFTVKDTGSLDSVRIKITAWDRHGWPPFPNLNYFQRHHGLCLDIRNAPVHKNSANFLAFLNANADPAKNFVFGYQTIGTFRVMGDHPKKRLVTCTPYCYYPDTVYPAPFPSVSLGDPSDADAMGACAGDCHLAIIDVENWLSYEFFRAMKLTTGPQDWQASPAYYDLKWDKYMYADKVTTPFGATTLGRYRGTSNGANVSGMSFGSWTLKADEILDGEVRHALGFWFYIIADYCVYPATKADVSTATNAPPLGLRLRLKSSYDINTRVPGQTATSKACRIVLRALQKYGMVCAQTAGSDRGVGIMTDNLPDRPFAQLVSSNFNNMLIALRLDLVNDFEVVDWDWQYQQYANYPVQ
jgi:hypothetical protein